MSGTIEVLMAACNTIQRAVPKGDPDNVTTLSQRYSELSDGFLGARDVAIKDTHTVVNNTWGGSAEAFEHFSHALTGSLLRHGQAATHVETALKDFAGAIKTTHETVAGIRKLADMLVEQQKHDEAGLDWVHHTFKTDFPAEPSKSAERIRRAHQLVLEALDQEDKLVAKATHLGNSIADTVHDLHLPDNNVATTFKTKYRPHTYAFSGGYHEHKVIGVNGDVVSGSARSFLNNAESMRSELGKALDGMHDDFGNDKAGHAFAKGYKRGWQGFVDVRAKAPDRLSYVGHGLASMVDRHARADHESAQAIAKITPGEAHTKGPRWLGPLLAHQTPLSIAARPPVPLSDDPHPAPSTNDATTPLTPMSIPDALQP